MTPRATARSLSLPDPGQAQSLDEVVERLRILKTWAGNPSYGALTDRINAAWIAVGRPASDLARKSTVADCFRPGRRRVNVDLFIAVVEALHDDAGYLAQWRQVLRVVLGEVPAAAQVRVQDELPECVAGFAGRGPELDQLRRLLRPGGHGGNAVIEGMAGVGKTQLAIRAGQALAAEEPFDHVLFVDLRGFHPDPSQPPADPAAVLDGFLRLLGVPGSQIPPGLPARTAAYQQRLAGARALVVLDNAASEQQVQPLLPVGTGSVTLITSRHSLAALHAAGHLSLDVFTPDEALAYLRLAAPAVALGEDPDALARVARRCGHLPLALSLIAGHLRAKPDWTVTDHAEWLDERHRTQRLDTGVELALGLSYQHLPTERRRLFRLLALHPGHDFDDLAAAALAGTSTDDAGEHLCRLHGDHLLQQTTAGRFTFHDLVRAYAADRAADEDRLADRQAALTRLFHRYLAMADVTARRVYPRMAFLPLPDGVTAAETAETRLWFHTEYRNLLAAIASAARSGPATMAWQLADRLRGHVQEIGAHGDWRVAAEAGLSQARAEQDDLGIAAMRLSLGTLGASRSDYADARRHFEAALGLNARLSNRSAMASLYNNLGIVNREEGNLTAARDCYDHALRLYRELGQRHAELSALGNLGVVELELDHLADAIGCQRKALAGYTALSTSDLDNDVATALHNLAVVARVVGRPGLAVSYLTRALAIHRRLDNQYGAANDLANVAGTYVDLGYHAKAERMVVECLAIARRIGRRRVEAEALNVYGTTCRALGDPARALAQHQSALGLSQEIGYRRAEIGAHLGIAASHLAAGRPVEARHYALLANRLATSVQHHLLARQALELLDSQDEEQRATSSVG